MCFLKTSVSFTIFCLLLISTQIMAQRPSYAGSRPGGLSQKDKYHPTVQTPAGGVVNRFGENNQSDAVNSIPFGATQRPPVGWPIVTPQAQYVPLNPQQGRPQVTLDNRISGNDIGGGGGSGGSNNANNAPAGNGIFSGAGAVANSNANGGSFSIPAGFQPVPPPAPVNALPLDAHGDQALIDYLNTVPLDQRPFWFLNYQAIEAQRNNSNPAFTGAVGGRGSFFG